MDTNIILMLHPTFGVLGILAAVWVFAETLRVGKDNVARIRYMSLLTAALMWAAYLVGGYWYVKYFPADKAVILAGPWPFAHKFFMETKEHLFFSLLLIATYLPIATAHTRLAADKGARKLVLVLAALIVALGLVMDGSGALIGLGTKAGLMQQPATTAR